MICFGRIDFEWAQTSGTPTDDQQGSTGQSTDQTSPPFIEYRISTSPSSDSSVDKKSSTSESKEKGRTKDKEARRQGRGNNRNQDAGKRKIAASTGQETSYLALLEWQ